MEYTIYTDSYTMDQIAYSNDLRYCEDIDAYSDDYTYITDEDIYVYDSSPYYYCDHCGDYVSENYWNYDQDCCRDCETNFEHIHSYHDGHSNGLEFFGDGEKFIGIELEVENSSINSAELDEAAGDVIETIGYDYIHCEEDCSLSNGFEIITQPFSEDKLRSELLPQMLMGLDELKSEGFTSHDSGRCGLHIHFSRKWFGDDTDTQERNIRRLIQFYNTNYAVLKKISRRNSTGYCEKNSSKLYGGHYSAVNTGNRNTIEIRLGRGTLDIHSFLAWLDLNITIVKNIAKGDSLDWHVIIAGIKDNTRQYINIRTMNGGAVA